MSRQFLKKIVKPAIGVIGGVSGGLAINYSLSTSKNPEYRPIKIENQQNLSLQSYSERSLENVKRMYPWMSDEIAQLIVKADVFAPLFQWITKNTSNLDISSIISSPYNLTLLFVSGLGILSTIKKKRPVIYNKYEFERNWENLEGFRNKLKDLKRIKDEKINKIQNQGVQRGSRENIELIKNKYKMDVEKVEESIRNLLESVGNREVRRRLYIRYSIEEKEYYATSKFLTKYLSTKTLDTMASETRFHNSVYSMLFGLLVCSIIAKNSEKNCDDETSNSTTQYQTSVVFLSTLFTIRFLTPFLNFKTGLISTPHFAALSASQLFNLEITKKNTVEEANLVYTKSILFYLILPASLILYPWFSKFKHHVLNNRSFGKFNAKQAKLEFNKDWVSYFSKLSSHFLLLSGIGVISSLNSRCVRRNLDEKLQVPETVKSREDLFREALEARSKVQDVNQTVVAAEIKRR